MGPGNWYLIPSSIRATIVSEEAMTALEERIDARLDLEHIIGSRRTTDIEAAYMVLAAAGYTDAEICRHFEWSGNRCQILKEQIREKHA